MRGKKYPPPGGLEPPTFRLTAERASRLRHGGTLVSQLQNNQMRIPINVSGLPLQKYSSSASIRYGLVVRIPGSHPGGPGSIPGNGNHVLSKNTSTRMGFEPTRAEPIGLAVQRLNHSATSSWWISSQMSMELSPSKL